MVKDALLTSCVSAFVLAHDQSCPSIHTLVLILPTLEPTETITMNAVLGHDSALVRLYLAGDSIYPHMEYISIHSLIEAKNQTLHLFNQSDWV